MPEDHRPRSGKRKQSAC